jgi:hypothetical protein
MRCWAHGGRLRERRCHRITGSEVASRLANASRSARARPWARASRRRFSRVLSADPVDLALGAVFVLGALFYLWTAGTSTPFTFDNGGVDRYNLLADAFLHLRLWVAHAPAALLHLSEPFNPAQNGRIVEVGVNDATSLHDDLLAGGKIYFLWGPAPALVLLVPLHLLGLEPSASVTVACFAIAGLGFALGTLRLVVRRTGGAPLWMCVLAAAAVALCSAIPFLLRTPSVTEDTLAGGFCFTMAGAWLALSAVAGGSASPRRVALASLCFGLAAGSRPPLALGAAMLVPVYLSLRSSAPSRRRLAMATAIPFGVCLALLLAYNQARFGDLLEFGSRHQLAGYDPLHTHFGSLSFVLPGAWYYGLYPPRPLALFPFIVLGPPPFSYPLSLPLNYGTPEVTGGVLPSTPILAFLVVLPWIWRRRPAWLGSFAAPLLALAGAGVVILLLLAYQNASTTERYEVEFSALLLLGALAAWLALARWTQGALRRLVRLGGGLLVACGCVTGLAISFFGYGDYLAALHPGTYAALQDASSPLSALIARAAGRPVLAEVFVKNPVSTRYAPVSYTSLDISAAEAFWITGEERRNGLTIVSPDSRTAALVMNVSPGIERPGSGIKAEGPPVGVSFTNHGRTFATYLVPAGGERLRVPVRLEPGVNRLKILPVASTFTLPNRANPTALSLLLVEKLSLESRY